MQVSGQTSARLPDFGIFVESSVPIRQRRSFLGLALTETAVKYEGPYPTISEPFMLVPSLRLKRTCNSWCVIEMRKGIFGNFVYVALNVSMFIICKLKYLERDLVCFF